MIGAKRHHDPERRYAIKVRRLFEFEWLVTRGGLTSDTRWLRATFHRHEARLIARTIRNAGAEVKLVRITYVTITPHDINADLFKGVA